MWGFLNMKHKEADCKDADLHKPEAMEPHFLIFMPHMKCDWFNENCLIHRPCFWLNIASDCSDLNDATVAPNMIGFLFELTSDFLCKSKRKLI